MTAKRLLEAPWPEDWDNSPTIKLDTTNIPDEVLATPVTLGIYATVIEGSVNGGIAVAVQCGERENPMLSPAELEYVCLLLEDAKRYVRLHFTEAQP